MADKAGPILRGTAEGGGASAEAANGERRPSPVAGPLLLWGLGVGYVISGDNHGWNFGLAAIGYWEFLAALVIVGGYLCGEGVIKYVVAPAVVATAIAVYIVFTAVHLYGVGSSLILVFFIVELPNVTFVNLGEVGGGKVLPEGIGGLWAALPLAAWFFLAIEGLPMAAEEARNPERDMPRALASSFITLAVLAFLTLTVAAGLGGAREEATSLPVAVQIGLGDGHWLVGIISRSSGSRGCSLPSTASYSHTPARSSRSSGPGTFRPALRGQRRAHADVGARRTRSRRGTARDTRLHPRSGCHPGACDHERLGAAISYILMMVSAIVLRCRRLDLRRLYRMPGGEITAWIALILALVLLPAGIKDYPVALLFGLLVFAAFAAYYFLHGRSRLVSRSIDEELIIVERAGSELR